MAASCSCDHESHFDGSSHPYGASHPDIPTGSDYASVDASLPCPSCISSGCASLDNHEPTSPAERRYFAENSASEAGDQADNEAAADALSNTISRDDIVASPQHGRFTGEFSYRVNHINHPYNAGRTYSGYSEDEAIDAHHDYLKGQGGY